MQSVSESHQTKQNPSASQKGYKFLPMNPPYPAHRSRLETGTISFMLLFCFNQLNIQCQALKLLDEDVKGLRQTGFQKVLAFDDGFVDPGPAGHIVRFNG